jgi:hypothetical protein
MGIVLDRSLQSTMSKPTQTLPPALVKVHESSRDIRKSGNFLFEVLRISIQSLTGITPCESELVILDLVVIPLTPLSFSAIL